MIAATAILTGLPLYTCSPRDFGGIDGLQVVAVELPGWPAEGLEKAGGG